MIRDDVEPFKDRMRELCAVFGKSCTKELVQGYWAALRDIQFDEFERNCAGVMRSATKETKWPKPAELRDRAPTRGRPEDPEFRAAERRSAENLETLRSTDYAQWERQMAGRPCVELVRQYGTRAFFDLDQWCWRIAPR